MTTRNSLLAVLLLFCTSGIATADLAPGPGRRPPGQGVNQRQKQQKADDAAAIVGGTLCVVGVAALIGLAIKIWIIVFIVKDAKKRGMDPTIWVIVEIFVGLLGLIIYLCVREPLLSERRRRRRYEEDDDDDDYDRPSRRRVRDDDDY